MSFLNRINPWGEKKPDAHNPYAVDAAEGSHDPFASAVAPQKKEGAAAAATTAEADVKPTATRKRWPWNGKKDTEVSETLKSNLTTPLDQVLRDEGSVALMALLEGEWVLFRTADVVGEELPRYTIHDAILKEIPFESDSNEETQRKLNKKTALNQTAEGVYFERELDQDMEGSAIHDDAKMVVKKSVVMQKSHSKVLLWSDGETWQRPYTELPPVPPVDERNSQYAQASTAVPLDGSTPPPPKNMAAFPDAVSVSCFDKHDVDGVYTASGHEKMNGLPVYCSARKRLYSGKDGKWMFSSILKMSRDLCVVISVLPHNGAPPDQMASWEFYDGQKKVKNVVQDVWSPCTLMSVQRMTKDDIENKRFVAPRKPISGSVRQKIGSDVAESQKVVQRVLKSDADLDGDEIRLVLEVFFETQSAPDGEREDAVIENLHGYVTSQKATLSTILSTLCKKMLVKDPRWTTTSLNTYLKNVHYYLLKLFFATYDANALATADSLMEDIELGRYSFPQVLKQICEKWEGKGAVLQDWSAPFPAGARIGFQPKDAGNATLPLKLRRVSVLLAKKLSIKLPQRNIPKEKPRVKPASKPVAAPAQPAEKKDKKEKKEKGTKSAMHALAKIEKAARLEIAQEHHTSLLSTVLPQRASLCLGVMALNQKELVSSIQTLESHTASGEEPPEEVSGLYLRRCSSLKQSVIASELAASLCAMPESLSAMVTKSKRNLAVLADSEGAVDELLQKKHDCEEKISATSATIKELVGQLSDDNENSDAKEELQRLNSEFTSLNESCNSLERSILERAGNSPLHAWRVTADKTKNPTPAEDTPADPKTTDEPTDNGEKKKKKHKSKKNKKEKSGEGGGAD